MLPPVKSDFLLHASEWHDVDLPQSDLVIINYLSIHGYKPGESRDYYTHEGFSDLSNYDEICAPRGNGKLVSVSTLHRVPDIWAQASFNAGAKFVVTHGGTQDEVTTNELKDHPQSQVLLCSEDAENMWRKNRYRGGHPMGVVANKDAISGYVPHVNKKSALGQALHQSIKLTA